MEISLTQTHSWFDVSPKYLSLVRHYTVTFLKQQKCTAKQSSVCLVLMPFLKSRVQGEKMNTCNTFTCAYGIKARSYFHFQRWNKIIHHNLTGNCQHPWLERAPTVCIERKLILGRPKVPRGNIFVVPSFSRGPHAL